MSRAFKAVVHVGAHKTGSSLVQKFLRDNRATLATNGLDYISRSDMNTLAGWGKPLHKRPELLRDRVSQSAADGYATAIASHENIMGRPFTEGARGLYPDAPDNFRALGELLSGFEYQIVIYLRPQADFVESYYLQSLHEGGTDTFDEWTKKLDLDSLSWKPVVESMHQAFGRERTIVKDFLDIKQGQDEYLRRFFSAIDVDPGMSVSYAPVRNPSVGDKGMRMALAVNPHVRTSAQRKAVRVFLQKHFSNRHYPRPVLLSDAQRQRFAELYDEEYQALCSG